MDICILTSTEGWGGAELHTVHLAGTLAARDHQITLVSLGHRFFEHLEGDSAQNFRLLHLDPGKPATNVSFLRWVTLLRKLRCDVCILVKCDIYTGNPGLDVAARLLFRNLITIEQLTPPAKPRKDSKRHFFGLVPGIGLWWYKHVLGVYARSLGPRRIVAVSETIRNQLVTDYHYPSQKVVTVRHGIDPLKFQPSPQHRRASRQAWGVPQDAIVFGSVARLANGHKGHDIALRQFARLCRENPSIPLWYVLVGEGPDRESLQRQAAAEDILERVVFAGRSDRPWEAHCALDFFLMPSRFEGIGMALMEAMACETCPIAMGAGGIPEVLSDPSLGWLVPVGDEDAFLAAMRSALATPLPERRTMGRRARQHIIRHFNGPEQLRKLAQLVEAEGARVSPGYDRARAQVASS